VIFRVNKQSALDRLLQQICAKS